MKNTETLNTQDLPLLASTILQGLYQMQIKPEVIKKWKTTTFLIKDEWEFASCWNYINLTLQKELPELKGYFRWNDEMVINYKNENIIIKIKGFSVKETISKIINDFLNLLKK